MDFNSIKVQLKLEADTWKKQHEVFQFHKGTIKTLAKSVYNGEVTNFNSIKVQLKQKIRQCV